MALGKYPEQISSQKPVRGHMGGTGAGPGFTLEDEALLTTEPAELLEPPPNVLELDIAAELPAEEALGAGAGAGAGPLLPDTEELELLEDESADVLDTLDGQELLGQLGHVHVPFGPQIGPPQTHIIMGGQLQLRSMGAQEEAEPAGTGMGAGAGAGPVPFVPPVWNPIQPGSLGLFLQHIIKDGSPTSEPLHRFAWSL